MEPEVTPTPSTPVALSTTPTTMPATPATTLYSPITTIPTTKSPGFEAAAALGTLAALVLVRRMNRSP
jgi:hypothetical protein